MQQMTTRPGAHLAMRNDWVDGLITSIANAVATQLRQQAAAQRNAQPAASAAGSPFMTVQEAAAFLRCEPQRVYDLVSAQRLRRYKDGGRLLIKRSELEMYVTTVEHSRTGAQRAAGLR